MFGSSYEKQSTESSIDLMAVRMQKHIGGFVEIESTVANPARDADGHIWVTGYAKIRSAVRPASSGFFTGFKPAVYTVEFSNGAVLTIEHSYKSKTNYLKEVIGYQETYCVDRAAFCKLRQEFLYMQYDLNCVFPNDLSSGHVVSDRLYLDKLTVIEDNLTAKEKLTSYNTRKAAAIKRENMVNAMQRANELRAQDTAARRQAQAQQITSSELDSLFKIK